MRLCEECKSHRAYWAMNKKNICDVCRSYILDGLPTRKKYPDTQELELLVERLHVHDTMQVKNHWEYDAVRYIFRRYGWGLKREANENGFKLTRVLPKERFGW